MRHHWLATYRCSLVAVLRAQGTDKGLQDGAAGVAQLLASSPLVQVQACFAAAKLQTDASQTPAMTGVEGTVGS